MIVEDDPSIGEILKNTKRIAVLGIKTEAAADQPAYYVPKYAAERGYDVIPVPVYYPEAKEILGKTVYRKVSDVPPPVDMVNVFRRPKDLMGHLDDILAAKPKTVWLQLGIRDDEFARRLSDAGITVVQDRCLLVELRARP
jgi:predicted CoA-binding protein